MSPDRPMLPGRRARAMRELAAAGADVRGRCGARAPAPATPRAAHPPPGAP